MAVFFKNDCKFNGCGKAFRTLSSLIEHIETVHINFDPKVTMELEAEPPVGVPLSYVLKYSHCRHLKETTSSDIKIRLFQHATKSFLGKHNRFGHPMDMEESFSESDSSNDSWTPSREVVFAERKNGAANLTYKEDKPFSCSMPGCKKRYKNINGIKYHLKNGHKDFEKPKKNFKQAVNKRIKESSQRMLIKKLCRDQPLAIQMPSTSKSASAGLDAAADHAGVKWIEDTIYEEAAAGLEKAVETEKHLLSSMHANNNDEIRTVCCTPSFMNGGNRWPATASSVTRNELTIIRPSMQNNDLVSNC